MIHWDDMPPKDEEPRDLVWLVTTLVCLVPKGVTEPYKVAEEAYDMQTGNSFLAGKPVKCEHCGWTAIDTKGFPWGEDRYGKGIYCSRCED